jgi:hypothetical protein
VTVTFHALWMFCALGAVAFGAAVARRPTHVAWLAAGFAVSSVALAMTGTRPDAMVSGISGSAIAAVIVLKRRSQVLAAAGAGVIAALFGDLLAVQGVPSILAFAAAALLPAVSIVLVRMRDGFAPEAMVDEAMLVILAMGLGVAMLPAALDGWQAALNLNVSAANDTSRMVPAWTLALVAASLAGGMAHTLWSRR